MKKIFYSFMAFAAMAMTVASCSSDIENNNTPAAGEKVAKTFSATQETAGATSRTELATGNKVNWVSGDAITVWDGTQTTAFTVTPKSDATTADISGSVTKGSTSFTAVYPNNVGQSCTYSDGSITGLVIPATQTATAGTFDPAAAIMTAQTTGTNLEFKHVCAFLKITAAAAYTKIVVSTTSADIAGTFSVVPSTGEATATAGANEITLSGSIAASTDYYIAIAPCANVTGLNVKCYTSATEYVEKTSSKTPTFARGGVYNMGVTTEANGWTATSGKENGYDWVDLGLPSGAKWASCNVGASSPEEYGGYFAWGETTAYNQVPNAYPTTASMDWTTSSTNSSYTSLVTGNTPKTNYWADNYKWGRSVRSTSQLKYKSSSYATLEAADDAASVNMGGTWRMPTKTEWLELYGNCYWEWSEDYNGKKGFIVYKAKAEADKGKYKYLNGSVTLSATYSTSSDAHIFLPAARARCNDSFYGDDEYGNYWSSTLRADEACNAFGLALSSGNVYLTNYYRYLGRSVRGLRPKN